MFDVIQVNNVFREDLANTFAENDVYDYLKEMEKDCGLTVLEVREGEGWTIEQLEDFAKPYKNCIVLLVDFGAIKEHQSDLTKVLEKSRENLEASMFRNVTDRIGRYDFKEVYMFLNDPGLEMMQYMYEA